MQNQGLHFTNNNTTLILDLKYRILKALQTHGKARPSCSLDFDNMHLMLYSTYSDTDRSQTELRWSAAFAAPQDCGMGRLVNTQRRISPVLGPVQTKGNRCGGTKCFCI